MTSAKEIYCLTDLDLTNNVPLEVMSIEVVYRFDSDFLLHPQMLFSLCTQRKISTSLVSLLPFMKTIPLLDSRPLLSFPVTSSIFLQYIYPNIIVLEIGLQHMNQKGT